MSDGCYLADALLVHWERALLAAHARPIDYRGRRYWALDAVPAPILRRLCWPRRLPSPQACAATGSG
jgi:hypothetical protein